MSEVPGEQEMLMSVLLQGMILPDTALVNLDTEDIVPLFQQPSNFTTQTVQV